MLRGAEFVLKWANVAVLVLSFLAIESLHASTLLDGRAEASIELAQITPRMNTAFESETFGNGLVSWSYSNPFRQGR